MAVQEWLRQVQLIELEALDEMMRICDKHNLTYYIDGGSLLGAVRHKGFIPWDDDIDFAMPRVEYDKFVKIAREELDPKFHFESMEYDPNDFYVMLSRIRRKNTIYMTNRSGKFDLQSHGIWIDIFPFDDQPGSDTLAMAFDWKLYNLIMNILLRYQNDNGHRTLLGKIQAFFVHLLSFDQYRKLAKRLMTRHNGKNLPYWKTPVLSSHYKRTTLRKSWSEPRITLEFEGRQVPAPSNYDAILTQYYGDYMTPPPEEKRKLHTPVRVSFDTNGPDVKI